MKYAKAYEIFASQMLRGEFYFTFYREVKYFIKSCDLVASMLQYTQGGDFMIMMYLLFLLSLIVCRFFASYDSRFQKGKYVVIRNPKLRILLIDETSFFERKKRYRKDINKMTVSGLIFYFYSLLTLVVSVLFYFMVPETPIEPWEIETDNFFMYVDTLNEKLAAISIWLFFLILIFCVAIRMIRYTKTIEQKWIKILTYIVSCVMIIVTMVFIFDIAREFIIIFL